MYPVQTHKFARTVKISINTNFWEVFILCTVQGMRKKNELGISCSSQERAEVNPQPRVAAGTSRRSLPRGRASATEVLLPPRSRRWREHGAAA